MKESVADAAERTYRAIGRFIFEFSQVEYTIRHYVGEYLGIQDKYFSAAIEVLDVSQLVALAKDIFVDEKSRHNAKEIARLLNLFHDLNMKRNRVAHGLWVPFLEGGTVHHVSRQKPRPKRETDQAAVLEQHADEACALRAALERAFTDLPEQGPLGRTERD